MKKFTNMLWLLITITFLPLILFAQIKTDSLGTGIGGGTGIGTISLGWFASLTGLVTGILFISGWLNNLLFKNLVSTGKQVVSWVVALGLAYGGLTLHLGVFSSMSLLEAMLTGVGGAIVANGIFDSETVLALLALFKAATLKKN